MKRVLPILLIGGGLVSVILVCAYILIMRQYQRVQPAAVPENLAGLMLYNRVVGKEAIGQINRLHNKEFELSRGTVGLYGDAGQIIIWTGGTKLAMQAEEILDQMQVSIKTGRFPFLRVGSLPIDGITVYVLESPGHLHYYFRSGSNVIWIQADPKFAETALSDALNFYR